MANNAQQSVTLDATQFIAATQSIAAAVTSMNQSFGQVASILTTFNQATVNTEQALTKMNAAMTATATASTSTAQNMTILTNNSNLMLQALTRIALNTQQAAQGIAGVGTASATAGNQIQQSGRNILLSGQIIGRLLTVSFIRRLFFDLIQQFNAASAAAIEFQNQMGLISGVASNAGVSVESLSHNLISLSTQFNQPIADVTKASLDALRQGLVQTDADMNSFVEANRLALITGQQTSQVVGSMTAIMKGFGLGTSEAARVTNLLNSLWAKGFDTAQLEGSIGKISAAAKEVGISIEEVVGTLSHFRSQGLSASASTTQLQQIINALHDPTSKLSEALRQAGFSSGQAAIEQLGFAGTLKFVANNAEELQAPLRELLHTRGAIAGLRGDGLENSIAAAYDRQALALKALNQQTAIQATDANKLKQAWNEIKNIALEDWTNQFISGLSRATQNLRDFLTTAERASRVRFEAAFQSGETHFNAGQSNVQADTDKQAAELKQRASTLFNVLNREISTRIQDQATNVNALRDAYTAAAKSIVSSLKSVISGFQSEIRKAESGIQDSLKRVEGFADKTESTVFQKKLSALGQVSVVRTPRLDVNATEQQRSAEQERLGQVFLELDAHGKATIQQTQLIQQRVAQLTQQATAEIQKGDEASVASGRRKFEEIRHLLEEQGQLQTAQNRRQAEALGGGPFQVVTQENALRALDATESAAEAKRQVALRAQADALKEIVKQEEQRLTLAEEATRRVSSFRLTSDKNPLQLQSQFRGEAGASAALSQVDKDIAAAVATLQRARTEGAADIQNALRRGQITPETAARQTANLPTERDITNLQERGQQFRTGVEQQLQAFAAQRIAKEAQDRNTQAIHALTETMRQASETVRQARTQQTEALTVARQNLAEIENNGASRTGDYNTGTATDTEVTILRGVVETLVDKAKAALEAATANRTPENVQAAATAQREVIEAFRALQTARFGSQPYEQPTGVQEEQNRRIAEQVSGLLRTPERLQQTVANTQGAAAAQILTGNQLTAISEQFKDVFKAPITNLDDVARVASDLSAAVNPNVSLFAELGVSVQGLLDRLGNLPAASTPTQQQNEEINQTPEGNYGSYATGGLIGNSFSSMGPDNKMINARIGEFVVNPESTRKFYSTLVAINRGDSPRGNGFSSGGTVNHTIGNVNFHVSGAGSPEQTARTIMNKIRREQRRGNI